MTAFREQWYVNHCVPGGNFAPALFRGYGKLAPAPSEAAANCLGRLKISTSERRRRRQKDHLEGAEEELGGQGLQAGAEPWPQLNSETADMQFQRAPPWLKLEEMLPSRSCRRTESGTSLHSVCWLHCGLVFSQCSLVHCETTVDSRQ